MLALLYRRLAPATDHPTRGAQVHTSGSAGVPKAVLHTCGNHYYNALGSNANLPLTAEDRWLLDLPLHHVAGFGIVYRCLLAGAAVAMPDRESFKIVRARFRRLAPEAQAGTRPDRRDA